MNNIKLSIVIPAYNIENTIERTLYSIIPQLTSNTELIIVNDGSTDSTVKRIETIIGRIRGNNIKIINTKKKGVLFARLNGFNIALGEYIWFIDGGDTITKNSILTIINALKTSSDIYHLSSIAFPTNNVTNYKREKITCSDLLLGKVPFSIWARVFKKKLLKEDEFDKSEKIVLGEDLCLSYLITENAKTTENINKVIYEYYLEENSVSHNCKNDVEILYALNFLKEKTKKLDLINEFNYFAHSQIIIKYLMLRSNKEIYNVLIDYYRKLKIINNPYIKMRRATEFFIFIKTRNRILDLALTKFAIFLVR